MREDTGLAEGIDPNGLESRQIAGYTMDIGLDAFKVPLGRQSESREQRGKLCRRWFSHCPILVAVGVAPECEGALFHERAGGCNGSRRGVR